MYPNLSSQPKWRISPLVLFGGLAALVFSIQPPLPMKAVKKPTQSIARPVTSQPVPGFRGLSRP